MMIGHSDRAQVPFCALGDKEIGPGLASGLCFGRSTGKVGTTLPLRVARRVDLKVTLLPGRSRVKTYLHSNSHPAPNINRREDHPRLRAPQVTRGVAIILSTHRWAYTRDLWCLDLNSADGTPIAQSAWRDAVPDLHRNSHSWLLSSGGRHKFPITVQAPCRRLDLGANPLIRRRNSAGRGRRFGRVSGQRR